MSIDIVARLKADTKEYDSAIRNAQAGMAGVAKAAQDVGTATAAGQRQAEPALRATSAGYRGFAAAAAGASNAVAMLTGTNSRAVMAFQMVNYQVATMTDTLARVGGGVGSIATKFMGVTPILAAIGGVVSLAVIAFEKFRDRTDKAKDAVVALKAETETLLDVLGRERKDADKAAVLQSDDAARRHVINTLVAQGVPLIEATARADREVLDVLNFLVPKQKEAAKATTDLSEATKTNAAPDKVRAMTVAYRDLAVVLGELAAQAQGVRDRQEILELSGAAVDPATRRRMAPSAEDRAAEQAAADQRRQAAEFDLQMRATKIPLLDAEAQYEERLAIAEERKRLAETPQDKQAAELEIQRIRIAQTVEEIRAKEELVRVKRADTLATAQSIVGIIAMNTIQGKAFAVALQQLAQFATVKAVMYGVEAVVAMYYLDFLTASRAAASAAKWGAFAAFASAAAGAMGSSGGAGAVMGGGMGGGGIGARAGGASGAMGSGLGSRDRGGQTITINVNVPPGGEAAAGRAIRRALNTADEEDGRS